MWVSLAEISSYASAGLGVYFFKNAPAYVNTAYKLAVSPQVSYAGYGPITDKTGWTRLAADFRTDSAYTNLVIGSFAANGAMSKTYLGSGDPYAYYYIDSVTVKPLNYWVLPDSLCAGMSFSLPYILANTSFNSQNTFRVQLSAPDGSFNSTAIDIGSKNNSLSSDTLLCTLPKICLPGNNYKLRIISTNPADSFYYHATVTIEERPVFELSSNSPLCEGDTLHLDINTNAVLTSTLWTGPNSFHASAKAATINGVTVGMSGTYVAAINTATCMASDTLLVLVKPRPPVPVLAMGKKSPICEGDSMFLFSNADTGLTYLWTGPQGYQATGREIALGDVSQAMSGVYRIVVSKDGCSSESSMTATIIRTPKPRAWNNGPLLNGQRLELGVEDSGTALTYAWEGPMGFKSQTQYPAIDPAGPHASGIYKATVTGGGCTGYATTLADVNAAADTGEFILYPNPNDGNFTIEGYLAYDQLLPLKIVNDLGQHIYTDEATTEKKILKKHVSMPYTANGVYFLHLRADGRKIVLPFVVKH